MPGDKSEMAKNIATSVAGSIGGNKVADALGLGGTGHIVAGVAEYWSSGRKGEGGRKDA